MVATKARQWVDETVDWKVVQLAAYLVVRKVCQWAEMKAALLDPTLVVTKDLRKAVKMENRMVVKSVV